MPKRWKHVTIAREIVEQIEEIVKSEKYGFRSVADFVDEAVKERLRKLGKYP